MRHQKPARHLERKESSVGTKFASSYSGWLGGKNLIVCSEHVLVYIRDVVVVIQAFDKSSVLRDHVFNYRDVNIESQTSKDRIRQMHYMEHARDNTYTLTPSTLHGYATIKAACYSWKIQAYIDTGSGILVTDDSIVPPSLAIKCTRITMKAVCGTQSSSYYVNVNVILVDAYNTEVTVKAYLVEHL